MDECQPLLCGLAQQRDPTGVPPGRPRSLRRSRQEGFSSHHMDHAVGASDNRAAGPDRSCLPLHHSHCRRSFVEWKIEWHDVASFVCQALSSGGGRWGLTVGRSPPRPRGASCGPLRSSSPSRSGSGPLNTCLCLLVLYHRGRPFYLCDCLLVVYSHQCAPVKERIKLSLLIILSRGWWVIPGLMHRRTCGGPPGLSY